MTKQIKKPVTIGNVIGKKEKDASLLRHQAKATVLQLPKNKLSVSDVDRQCDSSCKTCGGIGFISFDVPINHPKFGKSFPCPERPLGPSDLISSGINRSDLNLSWDNIYIRENVSKAIEALKRVLERKRGMVYLYGGYGLAKTLLLKVAIVETLRTHKRFMTSKYVLMPEMIDELRSAFGVQEGNPSDIINSIQTRYKKIDLLCIDEFGVERETPFSMEKQFIIINHRYEAAIENGENLITIMAGNAKVSELPGRIADRLKDGRCELVELTGRSFRIGQEPLK